MTSVVFYGELSQSHGGSLGRIEGVDIDHGATSGVDELQRPTVHDRYLTRRWNYSRTHSDKHTHACYRQMALRMATTMEKFVYFFPPSPITVTRSKCNFSLILVT